MHKKAEGKILKSDSEPFSEITWESSFKTEIEFPNYLQVFESFTLRVWNYNYKKVPL